MTFPNQTSFYRGKVRDVYGIGPAHLLMIASDRISAFDVILPRPIPHKGQVLTQLASFMLTRATEICPVWLIDTPAPQAAFGFRCEPVKVEVVVRGHLCGHAWRTYEAGGRVLCGATMPHGLREGDPFPSPIITPSTKAEAGHDEDIAEQEILDSGLVSQLHWETIKIYAQRLFAQGQALARERGLVLADTKYEFGLRDNEVMLMDEIHTPDSSRYFYADGFEERQQRGERQPQLSKEFVREWLLSEGFMGKEGQTPPLMSDDWVNTISKKYIELYEKVTGESFVPDTFNEEALADRVAVLSQMQN